MRLVGEVVVEVDEDRHRLVEVVRNPLALGERLELLDDAVRGVQDPLCEHVLLLEEMLERRHLVDGRLPVRGV